MTPRETQGASWTAHPTNHASRLPMHRERAEPLWRSWAVVLIVGAMVFVGAML